MQSWKQESWNNGKKENFVSSNETQVSKDINKTSSVVWRSGNFNYLARRMLLLGWENVFPICMLTRDVVAYERKWLRNDTNNLVFKCVHNGFSSFFWFDVLDKLSILTCSLWILLVILALNCKCRSSALGFATLIALTCHLHCGSSIQVFTNCWYCFISGDFEGCRVTLLVKASILQTYFLRCHYDLSMIWF